MLWCYIDHKLVIIHFFYTKAILNVSALQKKFLGVIKKSNGVKKNQK